MKRLSAQIGITCFSVLAVAFYISDVATYIIMTAAVIAAFIALMIRRFRKKVWIPAVALTAAAACALNLAYTYVAVIPVQERFCGSDLRIEAQLTDEVYQSYSKYYYRLKTTSIGGKDASVRMILKTPHSIDIAPFDSIIFNADVEKTVNNYYTAKGYYLTVDSYDDDFTVLRNESRPLYYHAIRLRQALRSAVDDLLPQDAASLCKAIFVGDKYSLDIDVKNNFRYAGASYFIVVSGLHFSLICLMLLRLLKPIKKRFKGSRFIISAIMVLFILTYMALTGFQPSVIRSGLMMLVWTAGRMIRRVGDSHSSLGIAALVIAAVYGPYAAGDIGLILSFAATFAIITWSDPIYEKLCFKDDTSVLKRLVNKMIRVLSISLAANILVFPISIFVFRGFSTVTLLSSLVLYIPVGLILILTMFLCIFFYLGPLRYISLFLSWLLYPLCELVLFIVDTLSGLSFSYIRVGEEYVYIWLTISLILGVIVIACRNNYRYLPYAAIISLIVLLTGMIVNTLDQLNTSELTVYGCEDGLTAAINNHGNLYMLAFDSRSKISYKILDELSHEFSGAELAVCSKKTEYKNYSKLGDREFAIRRYLMYDMDVNYSGTAEVIDYREGDIFDLGGGVSLTVAAYKTKLMSYVITDSITVLVLPDRYPYKAIPKELSTADVIVMSSYCSGYENLSCRELIISNNEENTEEISDLMSNSCDEIFYACDGSITVSLR